MNGPPDLLAFFQIEHLELLNMFDRAYLVAQNNSDWLSLVSLCKSNFEDNHHQKEETYIFEAVKDHSKIKSGGPLCTYFFEAHMMEPLLHRAIEAVRRHTGLAIEARWTPQMTEIRNRNLPLVIPGEDHEAGRILLRGVEYLLNSNISQEKETKIETLFNIYLEIQKIHFEREEKCFFLMCRELIPRNIWEQLYFEMRTNYQKIGEGFF